MKKFMEARVAHGLEKGQMGERFTLIDPARLPEKPVRPNRPAILLIGLFLGIGAGVGTASLQRLLISRRAVRKTLQKLSLSPSLLKYRKSSRHMMNGAERDV
jgi:capsular polysaccharide biosynthesis protein